MTARLYEDGKRTSKSLNECHLRFISILRIYIVLPFRFTYIIYIQRDTITITQGRRQPLQPRRSRHEDNFAPRDEYMEGIFNLKKKRKKGNKRDTNCDMR